MNPTFSDEISLRNFDDSKMDDLSAVLMETPIDLNFATNSDKELIEIC